MVDYKVLITTSGIGSRLGHLTNFTNKSLIRVGNKPVISYIIESYPKNTEFVISLGHFGSHVKQFLGLAYPDHNFTFVEIDKFTGDGSSLGYSIFKCKPFLEKPFVFHASDTIIEQLKIPTTEQNWIFGSYKQDSSHYRTLNVNNDKLLKINEKGEIGFDFSYVGVVFIYDFKIFFSNLEKLIQDEQKETSDADVINKMLSESQFYFKNVENKKWFDTGNVLELSKTRDHFKTNFEILDKKDENIFFLGKNVIKFFYDSQITRNRVERAKNLRGLVPEIVSSSENFYKYTLVDGNLLSKSVDRTKFIKFLNWSKKRLWIKRGNIDLDFKKKCHNFYIEKTKIRIKNYLENNPQPDIINGHKMPDIFSIIENLDIDWICDGIPSQFHGDYILDNILETKDGFVLLDWRQDFSGDLEIGDIYYDLSKLNHNIIINHDILNSGLYNFCPDDCFVLVNSKLLDCKKILESFLEVNAYDLKKVEVITSLIWLNMSALHEYPLNRFLFNFGKYNLYKHLEL